MSTETNSLWRTAERYDCSLRLNRNLLPALNSKEVRAEHYSRDLLFSRMARGEVSLFEDFPVRVRCNRSRELQATLVQELMRHFPRSERARVRAGTSGRRYMLRADELMRRWESPHARVCVTDLHIRDTNLERTIGVSTLSDFNLLCSGSEDMGYQEMMTLVVSSRGAVTDSHSDDPDGSNHSFVGAKLWLMWDTFRGRRAGIQDIERDEVYDRAAFDMRRFLSLESARWLVVRAGQTLFLPGNLTHKVITLEPYLGVGSFYVALPNALRTIARWLNHGPLWSLCDPEGEHRGLVEQIARTAARRIQMLRYAGARDWERWGAVHVAESLRQLKRTTSRAQRETLLANPAFQELWLASQGLARARKD